MRSEPRNAGNAISRMPKAVRDQVSRALEDGADWKAVRDLCKASGFPGVRAQNVTNYRKGAHQDWLRREERMDSIRRDSEATAEIMRHYTEHGGSPAEAGLLTAAELMSRAVLQLGPEAIATLIADDPKAIFGLTREMARVAEILVKRKSVDAAIDTKDEAPPALTPDQRAAAMKEIFGLPA